MATAVIMPKSGQSVESCIITSWNVKEGDAVKEGDLLFAYETDKASFEEYATGSGTVLKLLHAEGDDVPCLENVLVLGNPGEDISEFTAAAGAQQAAPAAQEAPAAAAAAAAVSAAAPTAKAEATDRMFISPRAKNTAAQRGVDPALATPTGPDGRIIERDIMAIRPGETEKLQTMVAKAQEIAVETGAAAAEYTDEPLPNVRKVIARQMHASLSNMAQLTNNFSFDATNILAFRKNLKANAEALGLANITINDIILYAVSRVLKNHRALNAHFLDDKMRYFENVNLGVAVDTPRGLLVPTLAKADTLSLNELSKQAKALISEAQSGSINPDKLSGGSFTVTNLGTLGVESFTPVINPPQTGILGVCKAVDRVKLVGGEIKVYPAMGLSLTYDHRAVDGAPASRFAQELITVLENFDLLLVK